MNRRRRKGCFLWFGMYIMLFPHDGNPPLSCHKRPLDWTLIAYLPTYISAFAGQLFGFCRISINLQDTEATPTLIRCPQYNSVLFSCYINAKASYLEYIPRIPGHLGLLLGLRDSTSILQDCPGKSGMVGKYVIACAMFIPILVTK